MGFVVLPPLVALAGRYGTEIATSLPPHVDLGAVADPEAAARAALAAED